MCTTPPLRHLRTRRTLHCKATTTCEGSARAVRRAAKTTRFSIAAARSQRVQLTVTLAPRATKLPVSVTVDDISIRHVVRVNRLAR